MSAWRDYVEWSGLDESVLHHPAGKDMPESPEVAEHRMDMEAVRLANSCRDERPLIPTVVGGILVSLAVFALTVGISVVAAVAGGWPL